MARREKRKHNCKIDQRKSNRNTRSFTHLQREIVSGRVVILFPDTFRTLRLSNSPIESGRDTKRLEETSSSSSFCSPAMESGRTCFPPTNKTDIRNNIKKFYNQVTLPNKEFQVASSPLNHQGCSPVLLQQNLNFVS